MKFEEVVDQLLNNGYVSRRSWRAGTFLYYSKLNVIEKEEVTDFKSMSSDMVQYLKDTGKNIVFNPTIYMAMEFEGYVSLFPYDGERDGDDWYVVG